MISTVKESEKRATPRARKRVSEVEKESAVEKLEAQQQQQSQPQHQPHHLTFLGALVAQRALRKFLAPHKDLLGKLNLRQFKRLCEF